MHDGEDTMNYPTQSEIDLFNEDLNGQLTRRVMELEDEIISISVGHVKELSELMDSIAADEAEMKRLRAKLTLRLGDWKDAPEWAKFRAYDLDGRGTWFAAEPRALGLQEGGSQGWTSSFGSQHIYLRRWRDSLEKRPQMAANKGKK